MKLTDRQRQVLGLIVEAGDRGIMCWQIRDVVYPDTPENDKMRHYRPSRGASNFQTGAGALGNLAVGRVVAALERKGLVTWKSHDSNRRVATAAGRATMGRP